LNIVSGASQVLCSAFLFVQPRSFRRKPSLVRWHNLSETPDLFGLVLSNPCCLSQCLRYFRTFRRSKSWHTAWWLAVRQIARCGRSTRQAGGAKAQKPAYLQGV